MAIGRKPDSKSLSRICICVWVKSIFGVWREISLAESVGTDDEEKGERKGAKLNAEGTESRGGRRELGGKTLRSKREPFAVQGKLFLRQGEPSLRSKRDPSLRSG